MVSCVNSGTIISYPHRLRQPLFLYKRYRPPLRAAGARSLCVSAAAAAVVTAAAVVIVTAPIAAAAAQDEDEYDDPQAATAAKAVIAAPHNEYLLKMKF